MFRRTLLPLAFGLGGAAVLVWLGLWQLDRLEWKQGWIAEIEARIHGAPVALPSAADPERDRYLPVTATGRITDEELHVLSSVKGQGAGYRVVAAFETGGRRVLLDRGFVREEDKDAARPPVEATITGNLDWPRETDGFTPEADLGRNIWFARDVDKMAAALDTDPLFIVERTSDEKAPQVLVQPISSTGIPNDHLQYALTWFSLAAIWLGMTGLLLWRIRR
ncbi:cytochrome oxidase biogenesis protein Surf1, facilitates heme A insertion [Brevirhabdus pacifica]|uniref:SURF1-like protein n=1 Tax=Brevirhabdus pacifica TaxID=1267768 RepID=A0A1U7DHC3_9RHOB|nr:SURF1 family protein [Brevirhabdus pacifica]APX89361.1 cytochrome oxidase biogenesis protein Surf1, facilitates heme A insertion [Brevirhabdus pacifica]OWU76614.1 cytochrome oxidase biogenesis protein Surf1, facilitates heme A insertion [Loktanella sp. 22II-4b]PJJ86011.1 surfeit locus 1 family protein [Brevirhabdus pacifica]